MTQTSTVQFASAEQAAYIVDTVQPGGGRATVEGTTVHLDDVATMILAELDQDADGHFDGAHVWIGGTEYATV